MIQAHITPDGKLVLQAGLMTEAYAVKCWLANLQIAHGNASAAIPASVITVWETEYPGTTP